MKPSIRKTLSIVTALAVSAAPAAAFASHYRSIYSTTSNAAGVVTWNLINATESNDFDSFGNTDGDFPTIQIKKLTAYSDDVASGTDSGVFTELSAVEDGSNSLYAKTSQVFTANVSELTNGIYEAYTESSARLEGVQNTNDEDSVSTWIRFSVSEGVPNLPPVFNAPSLYELIAPNGTVTADYRATDPEGGAVTYTLLTNTSNPVYAGSAIPCSNFTGGVLTIGPAYCTGGDVFANIYKTTGYVNGDGDPVIPSWTAKVAATDASGNVAISDVLFRMLSVPEPYISDDRLVGATDYELDIFASDTVIDFLSVECVNNEDSTDIRTAEGTSTPLTVRNLTIGAEYTCTPFARNAAGDSADEETYDLGPVEGLMLDLDLQVGAEFSGASSNIVGGGLKANSNYTLTMYSDPILIYAGVTDGNGNFDEDITIPAEACIPGIHHLILLGVDVDDNPVQDEQWVEIGNNCEVLRFSDAELAETGFDAMTGLAAGAGLALVGAALVVYRRRVRLS
jgi:LPXTG-motif cell wall-anchored protein